MSALKGTVGTVVGIHLLCSVAVCPIPVCGRGVGEEDYDPPPADARSGDADAADVSDASDVGTDGNDSTSDGTGATDGTTDDTTSTDAGDKPDADGGTSG